MSKKIIIIGAGIAGLSAGVYAQLNGYQSIIFELHDLPGGLCTAWERKGYTFDGCIHYLFGSGEGQPFYDVFEELGAVQDRQMVNHSELLRVIDENGQELVVHANPDELEAHMKQIAPEDARLIESFIQGIRQFSKFDMSVLQARPRQLMTGSDWQKFGLAMAPYLMPLAQWGRVSAAELAQRFKNPFLRRAIPEMFAWQDIPVMAGMQLLAYMHNGNAGYPVGGSLAFTRAIEQRYLELGGEIRYKAQVEKILVKNGRAAGVRLYNDEIHTADVVISAADGHATLFEMLGEEYLPNQIKKMYSGRLPVRSHVQVSLGVRRDLSHLPHWAVYLLPEPLFVPGKDQAAISVQHYCYDPSLAPPGHSCVVFLLESDYAYWQRIYGRKLYDTEQLQVAQIMTDFLETKVPGIRQDVEVTDVATPLSYERYTGNWQGATSGWLLTRETMPLLVQGVDKTLPKVPGFYMAGQWVEPGGTVSLSAMSGRNAVQLICREDRKPFTGW